MQFNSLAFLAFLPVTFLLYWHVFRSQRWQNLFVVIISYVFYGWWDARFLLLITLTSMISYASGLLIKQNESNRQRQKVVCLGSITANLTILAIFKYYRFFAENLCVLLHPIGIHPDWATLHIVLPVGISFYTFQALSYTIDVYRKDITATHDPIVFFAYISFFPQLVAGPIERASRLLPQFHRPRCFNYALAADGCRLMLWGFFKKMVIADNCATVVNAVWANYAHEPAPMLLAGAILFSFQIYGDFSGYSDIAIGCARLFGIRLMRNFDHPYFAWSIPQFWKRWHISLTTWLRDYIYIPMGGSRKTQAITLRNIIIVWCISGLWHGANWTFVVWGLYHALLLCAYRLSRRMPQNNLPNLLFTFFLTTIGWIVFRAPTLPQAASYLCRLANNPWSRTGNLLAMPASLAIAIAGIALLLWIEWRQQRQQHQQQAIPHCLFQNEWMRCGLYASASMLTIALSGSQSTFIYFQF